MSRIGIVLLLALLIVPVAASAQEEPSVPAVAQKVLSKEQIESTREAAAKLVKQKKLSQARSVYQRVIAADPNSSSATNARISVARTYMIEGKHTQAAKFLVSELAANPNLPPRELSDLQADLATVQLEYSKVLARAGKFSQANAVLDQLLERKTVPDSLARAALFQKAQNYITAKQPQEAAAVYRRLLERPQVSDEERLQEITALSAVAPQEVKVFQTFIEEHPAAKPDVLAKARYQMAQTYLALDKPRQAVAVLDEMIAPETKTPERWIDTALMGKAKVLLKQGEKRQALALFKAALDRPWQGGVVPADRLAAINAVYALGLDEDVSADVAVYLNHLTTLQGLSLSNAAPADDVLVVGISTDTAEIIARYKKYLRAKVGRATIRQLDAIAAQLKQGGDARPFVVSEFSKSVAKKISNDAPLGEYLKPLLNGDHQLAAQVAWTQARLARDSATYDMWNDAVAVAVRCHDQCRAGRAAKFLAWASGAKADGTAENPLSDFLGDAPIPFRTSEEAFSLAVKHLNTVGSAALLNRNGELSAALPDNDVLLVGTLPLEAAIDHYRLYLRRQAGRASVAKLKAVTDQLTNGGDATPFVISETAGSLSESIKGNGPLARFLRPLLKGDHASAARVAWTEARLAETTREYANWIEAVGVALRCHDQSYVRAQQLRNWSRNEAVALAADEGGMPAEDVLGRGAVMFAASAQAQKKALDLLNRTIPITLKHLSLVGAVPRNDVLLAVTSSAESLPTSYGLYLRRTDGRIVPEKVAAAVNQLTKGGSARPFVASQEAKALAKKISADAPMQSYLRGLLLGDYQGAAKSAWNKARNADKDEDYAAWVEAVALAVHCHDQTLAGRANKFVAWTKGTLKGADGKPVMVNPIADFLEE